MPVPAGKVRQRLRRAIEMSRRHRSSRGREIVGCVDLDPGKIRYVDEPGIEPAGEELAIDILVIEVGPAAAHRVVERPKEFFARARIELFDPDALAGARGGIELFAE